MKIAFVGQPEYFRFTYEHDIDHLAEVREFELVPLIQGHRRDELLAWQPDIVFFFRGESVPVDLLNGLKGKRVALSSEPFPRLINGRLEMTRDSLIRYLDFRHIRKLPFDHLFHYDSASLSLMARDGIHCSGHFPFPVATGTYSPQSHPKRWDLFFIGRSTAHREDYFGPLKHRHNFLHICHGVWGPDLVSYVCQARICLNVHAENEISWEPRVQMLLACGVLLISERITPNAQLRPGVDYVEVASPAAMHEAVEYYLANPAEREAIALSGLQRVREVLDSKTQFANLIAALAERDTSRFHVADGAFYYDILQNVLRGWRRVRGRLRSWRK